MVSKDKTFVITKMQHNGELQSIFTHTSLIYKSSGRSAIYYDFRRNLLFFRPKLRHYAFTAVIRFREKMYTNMSLESDEGGPVQSEELFLDLPILNPLLYPYTFENQ